MPVRLELRVEFPREPSRRLDHLHAMASGLLGRAEQAPGRRSVRQHWSVRPATVESPGVWTIGIGLLDDALYDVVRDAVHDPAFTVRLGSVEGRPIAGSGALRVVKHETWWDLATRGAGSGRVELQFVSPTCISRDRREVPPTEPERVLGGYRAAWRSALPEAVPYLSVRDTAVQLAIDRLDGVNVEVPSWKRSVSAVTGQVSLTAETADSRTLAAFGSLVALAPYCGTGAYTAYGFGATDLMG